MSYNPDEARDLKGEWARGGAGAPPLSANGSFALGDKMPFIRVVDPTKAEDALRVARDAAPIATALGFSPTSMNVTDDNKTFTLNGKEHPEAGHFDPVSKTVTLRTQYATPDFLPYLVTHEVMHAKYQAFLDDHKAEYNAVMKDPATLAGGMKPDGTLTDELAAKYPLYQAYTKFQAENPADKMAKEDGCTSYSRDWWDASNKNTATRESAYHETLAEMAALRNKPFTPTPVPPKDTPSGASVRAQYEMATQDFGLGPATKKSIEDWWADTTRRYNEGPQAAPPIAKWSKEVGQYVVDSRYPSDSWDKLYTMVNDNWKKKHTS